MMFKIIIYNIYYLFIIISPRVFKNFYPFGIKTAIVLTGSMEPTLKINDFVIMKKPNEIKVGDIISYRQNSSNIEVLHRVIKVDNDEIVTKGDANNTEDKPISINQITGVYIGRIKYLGNIIFFVKKPIVFSTVITIFIIIMLIPGEVDKVKKYSIKKKPIIILVLILLTFSNSYLLAKYTSSLNGLDSSSIADWNVTYDTSDNPSDILNLISGNVTSDYIIKVTSASEVSAYYSIILSNVTSEMEVKIDGGIYQTPTNNIVEFSNVGSFTGNNMNTTFTHTLTFSAPLNSNIASTTNVGIDIVFDQID